MSCSLTEQVTVYYRLYLFTYLLSCLLVNKLCCSVCIVGTFGNMKVLYSSSVNSKSTSHSRVIPQKPDRILDAPELIDNYCELQQSNLPLVHRLTCFMHIIVKVKRWRFIHMAPQLLHILPQKRFRHTAVVQPSQLPKPAVTDFCHTATATCSFSLPFNGLHLHNPCI